MGQDKEQGLNYEDCDIGRLVNVAASGFKLAVIVGYTRTGKIRICKWSNNSACWSLPQNHFAPRLHAIDATALSVRHRSVLRRAIDRIIRDGNSVNLGFDEVVKMIPHTDKLVRDAAGNVHFSRAKGPRP